MHAKTQSGMFVCALTVLTLNIANQMTSLMNTGDIVMNVLNKENLWKSLKDLLIHLLLISGFVLYVAILAVVTGVCVVVVCVIGFVALEILTYQELWRLYAQRAIETTNCTNITTDQDQS